MKKPKHSISRGRNQQQQCKTKSVYLVQLHCLKMSQNIIFNVFFSSIIFNLFYVEKTMLSKIKNL